MTTVIHFVGFRVSRGLYREICATIVVPVYRESAPLDRAFTQDRQIRFSLAAPYNSPKAPISIGPESDTP